jgi:hypothetical protein
LCYVNRLEVVPHTIPTQATPHGQSGAACKSPDFVIPLYELMKADVPLLRGYTGTEFTFDA